RNASTPKRKSIVDQNNINLPPRKRLIYFTIILNLIFLSAVLEQTLELIFNNLGLGFIEFKNFYG
ncbi:MAG: hypothetical protein V1890_03210, partial [Candidatus Zixiibacteriota bacterium]